MSSTLGPPDCPICSAGMVRRNSRHASGGFWGCSRYHSSGCKGTRQISNTGITTGVTNQHSEAADEIDVPKTVSFTGLFDRTTADQDNILCQLLVEHQNKLFKALHIPTEFLIQTEEKENMNQLQKAVQILSTNYKIAKVVFNSSLSIEDQKKYYYKIPPQICIQEGDWVVVNTSNDPDAPDFKGCLCVEVLDNSESIFIDRYMKWIVSYINTEFYHASMKNEHSTMESLKDNLRKQEAKQKRKEVIKGFSKKILKKTGLI